MGSGWVGDASATAVRSHNVIGVFRDLEVARDVVGRLREAGFTEKELTILGDAPEDTARSEHDEGEPLGGGVAKQTVMGGAGGGALGAALGAAGAVAVTAIPGVGLLAGPAAILGAISGLFARSTAGSVIVGGAALQSATGWAETLDSLRASRRGGGVAVGVHTDDLEAADRAAAVLEAGNATAGHRINAQGHEVG